MAIITRDSLDEKLQSMTVPAKIENLGTVQDFVEEMMNSEGAGIKTVCTVNIALEEMFVNVCHYAYGEDGGDVTVEAGIGISDTVPDTKVIRIRLADSGTPYDPLSKKDPDITLSADERPIGGLGIYMVKKSMDSVSYEYTDGQNIFTMEKGI